MTSERDVLELFERANPVPDPNLVTFEPDAGRFRARLLDHAPMVVEVESGDGPPATDRRRWLLPMVAAAAVAIVVTVLVVFNVEDADAPAPADTIPPSTTTPTTTTSEVTDATGDASDIVNQFVEAYRTGDSDTVRSLLADDVTITEQYEGPQIYLARSRPLRITDPVVVRRPRRAYRTGRDTDRTGLRIRPAADDRLLVLDAGRRQRIPGVDPGAGAIPRGDGHIDELHYGYGNNPLASNSAVDDLIFRTYPGLWDDLFGQVNTAEEAAQQARQQAAWLEIAMAECCVHLPLQ